MLPRRRSPLPAHVLNGVGVALGVGMIQAAVALLAGPAAAAAASSAAVCTSLADVPNTPRRALRRVGAAALVAVIVAAVVGALRVDASKGAPWLGLAVAAIAFVSALALAWGPRAGPLSFVGVLAFVFTMAAPPGDALVHAGFALLGAALYVAWALAVCALLQTRYRTLALASVLQATARLLRSRAALLAQDADAQPLQERIGSDAALEERLQAARDLLFAAREDDATAQRHSALLLLAIDLRDTLLASELDLDLLGADAVGTAARAALAANLRDIADALDAMQHRVRGTDDAAPVRDPGAALREPVDASALREDDARARLIPVLLRRARHMVDDVSRMRAVIDGAAPSVPLTRAQLQLFVSIEGWPLGALRAHTSLRSPVTRHALRSAAALTSAYFIALALPWASHPYWLVLSVAVVLRGNLEQTLARRNARVAGTALGCLVVLALAAAHATWLAALIFLVAVGVAHSFVMQRYLVTAAAASVMALLQAHLAQPDAGFAIPERLADTVLGALLAWGFSYVLPSWERRALPRTVARVKRSLGVLASRALQWPTASDVELRLARREVYDALASLSGLAQRTRVEPERVRVPLYALTRLLVDSHALLAHLAAVRLVLARRAGELSRDDADPALREAARELLQRLQSDGAAPVPAPEALPEDGALLPWLQRRLQLAVHTAGRVAHAAQALCATSAV